MAAIYLDMSRFRSEGVSVCVDAVRESILAVGVIRALQRPFYFTRTGVELVEPQLRDALFGSDRNRTYKSEM